VALAQKAYQQPTYGVGGVLLDNNTGNIIHSIPNNVIVENATQDPSAHGERQLITWYSEHKTTRNLPPPSEVTIVTTLDPCLMCTEAFLESGINVVPMSYDELAGINWTENWDFCGLPHNLRAAAQEQFSYFAVQGQKPWFGLQEVCFTKKPSLQS
jgi:tRNA(Arg) A34 adenosine deaminase TadA